MSYDVQIEWGEDRAVLKIRHDDIVIDEHWDGGEPEDNRFCRDWAWVAGALEAAYRFGLEDGRKEQL